MRVMLRKMKFALEIRKSICLSKNVQNVFLNFKIEFHLIELFVS